MLASAGEDGKFVLWDMKDGWPARTAAAHVGESVSRYSKRTGILDADFSRDGRLMTMGRDRFLRVFGPDGSIQSEIHGIPGLPLQTAFSPDGSIGFTGGMDGSLRIWSLELKTNLQTFENISAKVAANK